MLNATPHYCVQDGLVIGTDSNIMVELSTVGAVRLTVLCERLAEIWGETAQSVGGYIKYSQINKNNKDTFNTLSVEIPHHGVTEPR